VSTSYGNCVVRIHTSMKMMRINYWATPNMGKMHMMQLIEVNMKSYTKIKHPYYFYKQWHDPDLYRKRIEKTFVLRRGQSEIETPIKSKMTFGEVADKVSGKKHAFLNEVCGGTNDNTKMFSNTSETGGDLMVKYFGSVNDRKPPDDLMKDKDPVEVFFTDKYFREQQKYFPVSPGNNYLDTFLQPYLKIDGLHPSILPFVDELCDVDFIFDPFSIMGRHMLGAHPKRELTDKTEIEKHVLKLYKDRKNVIPYKENLIDCFASKLKRFSHKHVLQVHKTENAAILYKIDKGILWKYLDTVVKQVRRIELYFKKNDIEPVYFNMDRDDYKETFGFEKNKLPRTSTHPGDYPEREKLETIAKEYLVMRKMKDMRRRGRIYDWL